MKPAPFDYVKARSLAEAIDLLGRNADAARLLAGGQSLLATLNLRLSSPSLLIDINGISGLDRIERRDGMIEIGALVRYAHLEHAREIAEHAPLLARALPHIAHPAIRNRGTIGGSIAFADPAAELPACLLALGGEVEVAGAEGRRTIAADDFFTGLFETALAPQEVLTAIRIPAAAAQSRCGFAEFAHRRGDYAMVGLAASAHADRGKLTEVRLAYFGAGAAPLRARRAEAELTRGDLDAAVAALAVDLDPPDDVQASGAAKRHLAGVLLRRVALQLAVARS